MFSRPPHYYVRESADICKAIMYAEEGVWARSMARLMVHSVPLETLANRKESGSEVLLRIDLSLSVSECFAKTLKFFWEYSVQGRANLHGERIQL